MRSILEYTVELPSLSYISSMRGYWVSIDDYVCVQGSKVNAHAKFPPFLGKNSKGDYTASDWVESNPLTAIHQFISLLLLVLSVQVGIVCDLVLVWLGLVVLFDVRLV